MKINSSISIITVTLFFSFPLLALTTHYKNHLVGERGTGFGGAYAALSDDPSGMYYNPAGIAFGFENYLSISTNTFATSTTTYENIFPGQNYKYHSEVFSPSFFGFTQTFMRSKIGFAVIAPDAELTDQADTITRLSAVGVSELTLTRRFFSQDMTYLFGPAFATEVAKNWSIGISLFGFYRKNKVIDSQLILVSPIGTGKYFIQDAFSDKTSLGILPIVGTQFMPAPKWSVGISLSKSFTLGGSGSSRLVVSKLDANSQPVTPTGNFDADFEVKEKDNVFYDRVSPITASLGVAHFFSKELLVTAQFDYYTADPKFIDYTLAATYNWALGSEFYFNENLAIRGSVYSNNARTTKIDPAKTNQVDHVNMINGGLAVSQYRAGSSLTLGVSYGMGTGEGQVFSGSTSVQTVKMTSLNFFLSGSYQL